MLKSVGEYGKGLKPQTYHEVRVSYLKKAVDRWCFKFCGNRKDVKREEN